MSALSVGLMAALTLAQVTTDPTSVKPLGVGQTVPDVTVYDLDNNPVKLKEFLAEQKTVLIFYRGGWCPYCNRHLQEIGQAKDQILAKGYRIVAISPDRPEELKASMEKNNLDYTLLSDSRAAAIRAFGLAFQVEDELVSKYKNDYNIDLEAASGMKHHILPVPAVFSLNFDKIEYEFFNPDYRVRLKAEELLKHLK